MKISKRCFVRICSFTIAIILVLSAFILKACKQKDYLAEQIKNGYTRSLISAQSLASDINFAFEKLRYSSDEDMLVSLSTEIARDSAAAKECVSRMPIDISTSNSLNSFFTLAGDFAVSYAKDKSEKNAKNLEKLYEYSSKVTRALNRAEADFEGNVKLDFSELKSTLSSGFDQSIEDIHDISDTLPTLIYDGPFSSHVTNARSKLLVGKEKISKQDALDKAKKLTGDDDLKYYTTEKSSEESFVFASNKTICAITRSGGYLLYFKTETDEDEKKTDSATAIKNAKEYLKKVYGYSFTDKYFAISDNLLTVNLCPRIDGVCVYADIIKVDISLESGEIVGVEARSFVLNHHKRNYKNQFTLSSDKAQKRLNKALKITSTDKVLIIDSALAEHFCYEFICTAGGEEVAVYIDAKTGAEKEIFIIEHAPGGTFAK